VAFVTARWPHRLILRKVRTMSTTSKPADSPPQIPFMQRVLDNPFLLLFIGVTIPTVLYLIWGVMEVASVPLGE